MKEVDPAKEADIARILHPSLSCGETTGVDMMTIIYDGRLTDTVGAVEKD